MKFLAFMIVLSLFVSIEYHSIVVRMEIRETKEQLERIEKLLEQKEKK